MDAYRPSRQDWGMVNNPTLRMQRPRFPSFLTGGRRIKPLCKCDGPQHALSGPLAGGLQVRRLGIRTTAASEALPEPRSCVACKMCFVLVIIGPLAPCYDSSGLKRSQDDHTFMVYCSKFSTPLRGNLSEEEGEEESRRRGRR